MYISNHWQDYEILDTGDGQKLERWGEFFLVRPDPQVIWKNKLYPKKWKKVDGIYHRSNKGGGEWENFSMPDTWQIGYSFNDREKLSFNLKPFAFKHTGLFPEQAVNWEWMYNLIKSQNRTLNILNLFAYTGGATLSCAKAGASVTHVDASKGMVNWAKENASLSGLKDAKIRWLFDDCTKFVQREIRRENVYDGIIMDPPSYGRGPKGEIWRMEEMVYEFVSLCSKVLSKQPVFFLVNSYTTGLAPSTIEYILRLVFPDAKIESDEVGLPVDEKRGLYLPCGSSGRVVF